MEERSEPQGHGAQKRFPLIRIRNACAGNGGP
jgi:hypothetical protein